MLSALIHRIKPVLPVLLILCLMAALPALAVETPVMAQISISPNEMSEPGPVDVSISVKNISGADLTQPVTLYDPYGRLVAGFGQNGSATLKADAEMTVSLQDTVSQEMIDQGSMTYTLRWLDESGQELAVPVTAEVHFSGEKAGLRIVRTITPEVVRSGQTVKVSYELTNTGSVSISNIQVREKLSRTPKTLKNLAKGATSTVEFTAKMGNADLISSAEITYKPAGTGKFCNHCGAPLGTQRCPNCGAEVALGLKFCGECGEKIMQEITCPSCGTVCAAGAKFCSHCGSGGEKR